MTLGLETSSWASSTSLEFVPAPPVEMGGGGGGGGGRGGADNKRKPHPWYPANLIINQLCSCDDKLLAS